MFAVDGYVLASPRGLGRPRINIHTTSILAKGISWVGLALPYSTKFEICQRIAFLVGRGGFTGSLLKEAPTHSEHTATALCG